MALVRAEAPAVASELPSITRFLSGAFGEPVQIESMQLRWRYLLPVFDLHNVTILGASPVQIGEVKLGWHFILLKNFQLSLSAVPNIPKANYFNHMLLEQAVINFNQFHYKLDRLDLHRKSDNYWAWKGTGLSLGFGKLFLAPVLVNSTTGAAQVANASGQWSVLANNIMVRNKDILMLAKFSLKGQANTSPIIDLTAHYEVSPFAAADLKNYLPQTVLSPDLIQWLSHSIKNIDSADGRLILKGKLSDFPYDKNPGEFLIDTHIIDGTLDYFKNWPILSNINAELIFSNAKMEAHVHSAEMAYVPLQNIDVSIPVLSESSVLNISGNISTDLENSLYFIKHSPLQATIGKRLAGLQWTGPIVLGLQLNIPLQESSRAPVKVNGTINLKNTQLSFPQWQMTLKNLSGLLSFTEKGFSSQKLTATYSNNPVNITIDAKNTYHIQYQKYKADVISAGNGGWRINVTNPTWRGFFMVPPDPMKNGIKGMLYYFNVTPNEASFLKNGFKPSTLPPLNIQINNLRYKDIRFDSVLFQSQPLSNGLFLRDFRVFGPGYSIEGQGKWFDASQSVLDGKAEIDDLAKMIASWGLHPSLQGNSGQANFHLSWPGAVYSPDFSRLSGEVALNIGSGQVITSGSQAKMDFGRLLTILSFQSIQRRLSLDFSDLTKQGLAFESIEGVVLFNNNGAATVKNIILRSAVARVDLKGSIDLIHQLYGLNVTVTPHLTSSLPIVAAIAGGPVAGAAVWAASKVVNPLLNRVTEDQYSVTGPWANPVIKKV